MYGYASCTDVMAKDVVIRAHYDRATPVSHRSYKDIVVPEYDVGTLKIGFSMQLCIHQLIHAIHVLIPSASFLFALDSVRSSEIATSKSRQI